MSLRRCAILTLSSIPQATSPAFIHSTFNVGGKWGITPGQDFVDPNLANLNAGPRKIKFLLDAYRQTGNNRSYAFGGPFTQGFTWSGVPDFLFRGNMEALVADGTSVQAAPAGDN